MLALANNYISLGDRYPSRLLAAANS
ncbi:hypothetical protein MPC4_270061 [Methylocella tundrae]|uniref:Uncharacterized protein n=1 Tax=Methylocella tundrae TaxID=227605 RepID=A0A8B6M754_METTU|nr:hypothetical protein MPC4_270061 [Methylocella tundrae]